MPLSTRQYLKKLNREVNRLQDQVAPPEIKYFLSGQSGPVNDGSGGSSATFLSIEPSPVLESLGVGTSDTTRIGDEIKMQNLTIRGSVSLNSTENSASCCIRSVFYNVPDDSMSLESSGDGWTNTAAAAGADQRGFFLHPGPFQNKSQDSRYTTKILSDKTYDLSTTGTRYISDEFVLPVNKIVAWNPQVNALYPQQNSIYHLLTSSVQSTVTSLCPIAQFTYFTSFTDT